MGKLRGFYALFMVIAALCLNTFAFATDNHQKKDQRSHILSAAGDNHHVPISVIYTVNAEGSITADVQFNLPVTAPVADQYNEPEICPEDFAVTKNDKYSVPFKALYNIIAAAQHLDPGLFSNTVFISNSFENTTNLHRDPGLTFLSL